MEDIIEIVWSDGTVFVLHDVKDFELISEARCFRIVHRYSDFDTYIPAENIMRIGKVLEEIENE